MRLIATACKGWSVGARRPGFAQTDRVLSWHW